ncbi:hypothetical protein JCGZ_19396 [Jatropha curcas]|uniref:Uncharacterized protein n=1 Tax=Jatropha curcas TaxID=180498 RepID=A0A067K2P4_JATCU|nr:TPD1 protein homolog 1-like [Jatropha curcas]XP_037493724.1 TPD1 protein homolog 1-like [Jatropha curcas]KDP29293.1 hypothetical protein JCGZ_19396 [Jatropha curcas]
MAMIRGDKNQVCAVASLLAIFFVIGITESARTESFVSARKLLEYSIQEKSCSKNDIEISQASIEPLGNGIPAFIVQIQNNGASGRRISDIHVSCGSFSSAQFINPKIFRRIVINDCLVNDGNALAPGEIISYEYANSFKYPLVVSSVVCL